MVHHTLDSKLINTSSGETEPIGVPMCVRRCAKGFRRDKPNAPSSLGMGLPKGVYRVRVAIDPSLQADEQEWVLAMPRATIDDVLLKEGQEEFAPIGWEPVNHRVFFALVEEMKVLPASAEATFEQGARLHLPTHT